jgi:uroporphyrinogen-III synthase
MGKKTPKQSPRIAITREHAGEMPTLLAAAGLAVTHCPLLRTELVNSATLADLVARHEYTWLVFTSARAVAAMTVTPAAAVACVGDSTAQVARDAGFDVQLVPQRQHVKGLIEAFARLATQTGRVLYPRSEIAPSTLKEGLQALGFVVDDPVAYRNAPDDAGMKAFAAGHFDAATFASPSAVKYAVAAGADMKHMKLFSIGPSTSAAIRDAGFGVCAEALEHSEAGLARAIIENLHG